MRSSSISAARTSRLLQRRAAAALRGKRLDAQHRQAAADALARRPGPMSNAQGSAKLRLELQRVLTNVRWMLLLNVFDSSMSTEETVAISLTVNGEPVVRMVPVRQHLVDFLRTELGLTGAHLGCEHGVCGACSVRVDGVVVRGCLMLAVQADGSDVVTIEGLTDSGEVADLQAAFVQRNALQCGFCTPGMLMTAAELLAERQPRPGTRSGPSCPATTAAAPAITPSSMRWPPPWKPARRAADRERQDPPRPVRQTQQLRRPHPLPRRGQTRRRRPRPLHRRLLAPSHAPCRLRAQPVRPCENSFDRYGGGETHAGRPPRHDGRRTRETLHRPLGRHAHLLSPA